MIRSRETRGTSLPFQKFLLGTAGEVAQLPEAVTGHPVSITTLVQEVMPADAAVADRLIFRISESVNHGVVEHKDAETGTERICAVLETPLSRLSPAFS